MFRFNRILVPTDFSSISEAAVDAAASLAEGKPAELFLIHVIAPVAVLPPLEMAAIPVLTTDDGLAIQRSLDRLIVPGSLGRMPVHREILHGVPEHVIADYADDHDIDVIVMGTHSRTGLSHFVLGSVTESVVRHVKCPVLTVPAAVVSASNTEPQSAMN